MSIVFRQKLGKVGIKIDSGDHGDIILKKGEVTVKRAGRSTDSIVSPCQVCGIRCKRSL